MIGKTEKGLLKDTIFLTPDATIDVETQVVMFVLKPNPDLCKVIVRLVSEAEAEKKFMVFFCPRYTVFCKEIFEEGKVLKSLEILELPYELIPLEKDVLTLDDDASYRNLTLNYNYMSMTLVKHSIQRLETLYGKIPLKFAKGAWSVNILESIQGKEKEIKPGSAEENQYSEIDALVLLDRTVDLYTPLVTQMTYEGIIDEFFNIKTGTVSVDEQIVNPETKGPAGKKTLFLFSNDDIMFGESRDLHFNMMKVIFPKKFEEMKSLCEKKDAFKTISEMTEYMRRLRDLKIPQLKSFFNININLSSYLDSLVAKQSFKQLMEIEPKLIQADDFPKDVAGQLEVEIAKCEQKTKLLRLLCLTSLVSQKFPKDVYNTLVKEYVDAFGIAEYLRILNLERAGILRKEKPGPGWKTIRDTFKLILENVSIEKPNDIAYAYSGYAPLAVRVVEKLLENGWTGPESIFAC